MNIFKDTTFTWLQIGAFKLATIGLGVAIGAYWSEFFMPYLSLILAVVIVASLYISVVWFKQH